MATTFTNQATLTVNGTSVQSNIAVGLIEGILSVSKQSVTEEYGAGDTLTYVVSIVNDSDTSAEDLTVSDDLGAYDFCRGTRQPLDYVEGSVLYYRNGELQPDPAVSTDDGLTFTGITVPANGNVTIIYQATVNAFAPLEAGSEITNTVTVTGDDVCGVEAEETVTVDSEPLLSIVKSVAPIPVAENGELTYTFQLQNSGNTAISPEDNAVITDTFDPLLSDIRVALNGVALTAGTDYTYNETTGAFATVAGVISIPAAAFTQDPITGEWSMTPGSATLTVTGTVGSVCDIIS